MSPALVVIDMQKEFCFPMSYHGYRKSVRKLWKQKTKAIQNAIRTAQRKHWKIILVEYRGMGKTIPEIRNLVKKMSPKRWMTVIKNNDDGSDQVIRAMKRLKVNRVYLTGCNADACVLETWGGLTDYGDVPHAYPYIPGIMTFNDTNVRCNQNKFIHQEYYNDPRACYRLGKNLKRVPDPPEDNSY